MGLLSTVVPELITDAVIKAKTNGDKTKQAARAAEILTFINGFQQLVVSGDVTGGIAAIEAAAAKSTVLDPGEAIALQDALGGAAKRLSAIQTAGGGTLLGQFDTLIVTGVLAAAAKVCSGFTAVAPPVAGPVAAK